MVLEKDEQQTKKKRTDYTGVIVAAIVLPIYMFMGEQDAKTNSFDIHAQNEDRKSKVTQMRLYSLCALVGVCLVVQASTAAGWNDFNSSKAFSVSYPSTWFRHGITEDGLDILSSKYGADAVGIKRNEAEIMVFEAQGSPGQSLSEIIDFYTKGGVVLLRNDVTDYEATKNSCRTLRQVVIKEEAVPAEDIPGPVPHVIYSDFFCEVSGHKFVTILKNWQGDKRQEIYQRIALNIAKSLRYTPR